MTSPNDKEASYDDYNLEEFELSDSEQPHSLPALPDDGPVIDVLEEPNGLLEFRSQTSISPLPQELPGGREVVHNDANANFEDVNHCKWQPPTPLSQALLPSLEANDKTRVSICKKPYMNEEEWNMDEPEKEAFRAFVLDQSKLILWLAQRRLISNECYCTNCPRPVAMGLSREISHSDFYVWRCRKCSRRFPIRLRSVFDRIKCTMDVLVYLMYMWSQGSTFDEMCNETGASPAVVSLFVNRLRTVCSWQLKRETDRLEGVIEIAEGAYLDPPRICALAGVERFGTRCFLIRLPQERCNQKLLIRFIRHRVKPGSTIITSDWPGYKPLGELPEGYAHLVADPDRNVSIQKADNLLEQLALFIDDLQTDCREQFSSILDEFVWRKLPNHKRFSKVCFILSQLYNVS